MSGMRIVLLAGGVIALIAVAAFFLLVQNLDRLVKHSIEASASAATGTPVHIDSVAISLREGRGTIRGLTIASPEGFSGQPLLILDSIDLRLDPATLTAAVPVIDEIRVGPGRFHYEVNLKGENNLRSVQKQARRQQQAAAPARGTGATPASKEKRFRIRRLIFAESTATLDLGPFGAGQGAVRVPGVSLTDLGGEHGATAQELAAEIIAALGRNLSATVGGDALKKLGESFREALRNPRER